MLTQRGQEGHASSFWPPLVSAMLADMSVMRIPACNAVLTEIRQIVHNCVVLIKSTNLHASIPENVRNDDILDLSLNNCFYGSSKLYMS